MNVSKLITIELFEGLFPVDNKILTAICEHMLENGYDESQPIIIWKGKKIVVDGHTRLLAAKNVGRGYVLVVADHTIFRRIVEYEPAFRYPDPDLKKFIENILVFLGGEEQIGV